jgi:hypothetical protein
MRKVLLLPAAAAVAAIPAISAGCNPAPLGEIVLVVTTDMAPPKDFNKLRIQIFKEGTLAFQYEDLVPGDPKDKKRIVIPSTLGLVAGEDASKVVRIEVGVRSGAQDGPVRVVREAVTTVPPDRVVQLNLPIQFLCKASNIPYDNDGNLTTGCDKGKTCIAGTCQDSTIDSRTLPDYDPKNVFGGASDPAKGACFDVAKCFQTADLIEAATFDIKTCSFPLPASIPPADLNLALGVESDGICNGRGCFIVLDAGSDTGWKLDDSHSKVLLPQGVCDNLQGMSPSSLKVLQIVQASTGDGCPQKSSAYPTCGPWSAVQSSAAAANLPVSVAGAQDHPISVAVLGAPGAAAAFWTNSGDSSIRHTSLDGGSTQSYASAQPPRDVIALDQALLWTAADASKNGMGTLYSVPAAADPNAPPVQLKTGLTQPDGIAFYGDKTVGNKVFWTEFTDPGRIFAGTLNAGFTSLVKVDELAQNNSYPYRIVADGTYAYWTNEGTFGKSDGSVARVKHSTPGDPKLVLTPTPVATPRAIALDVGMAASDLYFATLADGKVWRIPAASTDKPGDPEEFATGLSSPNGIAVDAKYVYVSNRGDGTILYKPKSAAKDEAPKVLVTGQKNPGTILVHNGTLVWVNEGPSASDTKEGSIVRFDVSQL